MRLPISRLRRWFATGAIILSAMVAMAYFYARWHLRNALKEVPQKIGLEIQQSTQGFTISKSEAGRTLFKVQASRAVQFKQGGRADLHDVNITLYGSDSSRFDQIYGADFEYDPQSGNVTAKGPVQIDLESNPAGLTGPDQVPPKELKNPIHLRTSGLVFNQKSGNAYTDQRIEFRIPQVTGSAVGASYSGKESVLRFKSQLQIEFNSPTPAKLTAAGGTITKTPRQVVLDMPHLERGSQSFDAAQATFFLRPDNTVDRIRGQGDVRAVSGGPSPMAGRAAELELVLSEGQQDTIRTAILSGNVHVESMGKEAVQGQAGRVVMDFTGKNLVKTVQAEQNVILIQHGNPGAKQNAQDVELAASRVNFAVAAGRRLENAETAGPAQIVIRPTGFSTTQRTVVTAGKFIGGFDHLGRLVRVHGAPAAKIVSTTEGQPDRVTASDQLDVVFHPTGGIESILQQGNFIYAEGDRKAWAARARYNLSDQIVVLDGSPRVTQEGMTTTAQTISMNRGTGDAIATSDVKSTYSNLKSQPDGALLGSASPIHVTSQSMTAHRTPAIAIYTGDARLWQDANVVQAPSIKFDRDRRLVVAKGNVSRKVSTVLVEAEASGKTTPVTITSDSLSYADKDRKIVFVGEVTAKRDDLTITSDQMEAFLRAKGQSTDNKMVASSSQLERIVGTGHIVVSQATRKATGDQLVYTAADDKFVLKGGPPSIFDAERGKITGDSLTFFRRDDRVLVEGRDSSPTITQTRVAR